MNFKGFVIVVKVRCHDINFNLSYHLFVRSTRVVQLTKGNDRPRCTIPTCVFLHGTDGRSSNLRSHHVKCEIMFRRLILRLRVLSILFPGHQGVKIRSKLTLLFNI